MSKKTEKHLPLHTVASADVKTAVGASSRPVVISEISLKDEEGKLCFYTLSETDSESFFYRTEESILSELAASGSERPIDLDTVIYSGARDECFIREMPEAYEDIFIYLIYLARASQEDVKDCLLNTVGQVFEHLVLFEPDPAE